MPHAALHEGVRQRASSRRDLPWWSRRLLATALAIAVAAHLLVAWWLRDLMQPPLLSADEGRVDVRLIDAPPPEPPVPDPPPPPERERAAPSPAPRRVAAAARAVAATPDAAPASDAPLQLVDREGSIVLPKEDGKADSLSPSAFIAQSTAPTRLMGPHRPLKIRPNYFARAWRAPENENLLGETLRKVSEFVDENLTAKKEFTTPWGSKIKCQAGFMFVMAMGGCGWGFPPPPGGRPTEPWKPATELDEH
ncbi:MAG: hypothetical protein ABI846_04630 [Rudaea sp.]